MRIVALILVSATLITVLRTRYAEYGFLLSIAVVSVIAITVFADLFGAISKLKELFNQSGNAAVYFVTALKALGISYIAAFAADTCRDFGMSALAQMAEISGKVAIFVLSVPLVTAVLETALKFVGL